MRIKKRLLHPERNVETRRKAAGYVESISVENAARKHSAIFTMNWQKILLLQCRIQNRHAAMWHYTPHIHLIRHV